MVRGRYGGTYIAIIAGRRRGPRYLLQDGSIEGHM
jgi:hypothetical protein